MGRSQIASSPKSASILLLFALGVEFSIRELRSVGRVVIPGAIRQVLLVLGSGTLVMVLLGTQPARGSDRGRLPVSLSSTIVVLKQLIDRGEMDSAHGRAAVGWSIVQDIATIVFIVALPPLAGGDVVVPFAVAMVKAAVFLGHRLSSSGRACCRGCSRTSPDSGRASCSCSRSSPRR